MSETMNFSITESALAKIRSLLDDEGNPSLMLRILWTPPDNWGFQFEDSMKYDDRLLEFPGVKVLLSDNVIDRLRDATVGFNDEAGFQISNAETPDHSEGCCSHLDKLPRMPDREELKAMRKGLRKQKLPDVASMTYGEHSRIGKFVFEHQTDNVLVTWNLTEGAGQSKQMTFAELCFTPEHEQDRLELGWMIANMARLDMEHELEEARNIPDPNYCMREMSRIMGYFGKIEKRWRHWAIVPAGHMLA